MSKKDEELDLGFPKKWQKHLPEGWKDTAESLSEDDLKKTIVDCQKTVSDTESDMDRDEHLNALKEEMKDVTGGYKSVINMNQAKIRYCVYLMRQRGQV